MPSAIRNIRPTELLHHDAPDCLLEPDVMRDEDDLRINHERREMMVRPKEQFMGREENWIAAVDPVTETNNLRRNVFRIAPRPALNQVAGRRRFEIHDDVGNHFCFIKASVRAWANCLASKSTNR